MTKNPKIAVVEQYIKALSNHDTVAIDTLFTDNATVEDPVGSEPISGKAAILRYFEVAFSSGVSARLDGAVRLAGAHGLFPVVIELNPGNGEVRIEIIIQFTFDSHNKIMAMKAFWSEANMTTP
ncbi:nuclear transport factor 2 family protein [Zhongshania guokunii]|uniref:Nuclear transport factor 2 family protein n=1 Tax=Zhongshania guokunii TaxID=641783 RepID=A0ABV3U678_9GAMM